MPFFQFDIYAVIFKLTQEVSLLFSFIIIFLHKFSVNYIEKSDSPWGIQRKGIVFFSLISILTVLFPIPIILDPKIVIDLRVLPIALSAVYLGITDSIIIGVLTIFLRYMTGGSGWILWIPAALTIGPLSWFIFNHPIVHKWNRTIVLIIIGFLATLTAAFYFALIAISCPLFSMVSPLFDMGGFIKIFIPLFVCNPLSIVVVDWALCHINKHQHCVAELKRQARIDEMTDLYNHRTFQRLLSEALDYAQQDKKAVSLLMLDLDHFKDYNDTFGHPSGDEALRNVGVILNQAVREFDIVARYGGEEFSVILPNTSLSGAVKVAERIREKVKQFPFKGEDKLEKGIITISIGVAEYPLHAIDKNALINAADQALYNAKHAGGNRVVTAK